MALHKLIIIHLLVPLVFIISFSAVAPCFGNHELLHDDGHVSQVANVATSVGYDTRAYPFYFNTIEDNYGFEELFRLRNEFSILAEMVVNVDDFGARGDGSDATEAFNKAWKVACSTTSGAVILVPQNKIYLLKPIKFSGPCKSDVTFEIRGTIKASGNRGDFSKDGKHWLEFESVQNLLIEGGGTINGNGNIWWQNSCKINISLPCKDAPTALTFYKCKNLSVKNLKVKDAQQMHISFQKSVNVVASNLTVTSPEKSPNTDGIHITDSQNVQITNSVVGTGDDCISIVSGSAKVQATDIVCGPGHGISIGSLGKKNSEQYVSDILVNKVKFIGTTNGVRIKTWQGGSGSASNIKFQNIQMSNVTNPIIVDQNYCDQKEPCTQQGSAVQVKNVVYQNIIGTSASDVAVKFDCSESYPCQGIVLQDINIERQGGESSKALCSNVKLTEIGDVSPNCP